MFERIFIVAEAGSNHNGDLDTALELVRKAKDAGADAVKFQNFTLDDLFSPPHYEKALNITDSSWKTKIKHLSFKPEWNRPVSEEAHRVGIHYFSTPFSVEAVETLEPYVPFYKISSGDITHITLLKAVAEKKKGVFISTGASTMDEIDRAVHLIRSFDPPFICIMHCVMLYPPPDALLNLRFIDMLKRRYDLPVGFSDHTAGTDAAIVCVGKGIAAIEKHFTLDSTQEGADHRNSLDPTEFKIYADRIRIGEKMCGDEKRDVSTLEARERIFARRGVYAAKDILRGEKLSLEKLRFLRPNIGIGAEEIDSLLNRRAAVEIKKGAALDTSMLGVEDK